MLLFQVSDAPLQDDGVTKNGKRSMRTKNSKLVTLLTLGLALSLGVSAFADSNSADVELKCYVSGDTSANKIKFPPGSRPNPYSSLQDVEANPNCNTIVVLYSEATLDGGIQLDDGQSLIGRIGP